MLFNKLLPATAKTVPALRNDSQANATSDGESSQHLIWVGMALASVSFCIVVLAYLIFVLIRFRDFAIPPIFRRSKRSPVFRENSPGDIDQPHNVSWHCQPMNELTSEQLIAGPLETMVYTCGRTELTEEINVNANSSWNQTDFSLVKARKYDLERCFVTEPSIQLLNGSELLYQDDNCLHKQIPAQCEMYITGETVHTFCTNVTD